MDQSVTIPTWEVEFNGEKYIAEIAVLEKLHLGVEDHGLFVLEISFSGDGWGQGVSPHSLDDYDPVLKKRVGTAFGMEYIMEIIKRLGSPENAKGQQVVVFRKKEYGLIEGFASMNKKGSYEEPFFPQKLADKHYPK